MRILVTDSDTRSALAAVRALGRAGHEVITAGDRQPSLASVSRYCSGFEGYPHPGSDPDAFVTALVAIASRRRIDLLLPMTEITTLLATEHRERLPTGCRLPFPAARTVSAASDKAHVVRLADELGVPTPRTLVVDSADEGLAAIDLPFPVVVKPARSRVRTGSNWLSTGVSLCRGCHPIAANPD